MILRHGAVGLLAGIVAAVICFLGGFSIWSIIGAYFAVAAMATIASAALSAARHRMAPTTKTNGKRSHGNLRERA